MKGYPTWFLRTLLVSLLLVLVTGLLLAPTTLVMRFDMDVPWRLPGEARILGAAAHALLGFIAASFMGALWSVHMRSGWRRRKHRASGTLTALLLALLAVSAIGVYYLGDDTLGAVAAAVHLGIGIALVLPFTWHWIAGRRHAHLAARLHAVGGQHDAPSRRHGGTR